MNGKLKKVVGLVVRSLTVVALIYLGAFHWNGIVPNEGPSVTKQEQPGATLVMALKDDINRELAHGWVPNDWIWPPVVSRNYADFQMGKREVWKRTIYELRDHMARTQTTNAIDQNIEGANDTLNNDPTKFMLPSFESKLWETSRLLEAYLIALPEKQNFQPRADHLRFLIESLDSMMTNTLNGLAQALPSQFDVPSAETAGDTSADEKVERVRAGDVGFWESSRIFFDAKGQAYATLVILEAAREEFKSQLTTKNSLVLMDDALFWLREAVELRPTIIMNGARDGIFANHLDNFSAPFGQARTKLNLLKEVLKNG
jgi:hypothetical protein